MSRWGGEIMRKVLGLLLVLGVLGIVGTVQAKGPPDADGNLIVSSGCGGSGACEDNEATLIVNSGCDGFRACEQNENTVIVNSGCGDRSDCDANKDTVIVNSGCGGDSTCDAQASTPVPSTTGQSSYRVKCGAKANPNPHPQPHNPGRVSGFSIGPYHVSSPVGLVVEKPSLFQR
jgi:hypothetical protein